MATGNQSVTIPPSQLMTSIADTSERLIASMQYLLGFTRHDKPTELLLDRFLRTTTSFRAIGVRNILHPAFTAAFLEFCKSSGRFEDPLGWGWRSLVINPSNHSYAYFWLSTEIARYMDVFGRDEIEELLSTNEKGSSYLRAIENWNSHNRETDESISYCDPPENAFTLLKLECIQAMVFISTGPNIWEAQASHLSDSEIKRYLPRGTQLPSCPQCGSKMKNNRSGKQVNYYKCTSDSCGHSMPRKREE